MAQQYYVPVLNVTGISQLMVMKTTKEVKAHKELSLLCTEIGNALHKTGFFVAFKHDIADEILQGVEKTADDFFRLPEEHVFSIFSK